LENSLIETYFTAKRFPFKTKRVNNFLHLYEAIPGEHGKLIQAINNNQIKIFEPTTILTKESHILIQDSSQINLTVSKMKTLLSNQKSNLN
jgi:hypothetical protein